MEDQGRTNCSYSLVGKLEAEGVVWEVEEKRWMRRGLKAEDGNGNEDGEEDEDGEEEWGLNSG